MFKVRQDDVIGFLLTKGCWWDGLIGDRFATEEDFNKTHDMASVCLQVVTTKGTQYLDCELNAVRFVTKGRLLFSDTDFIDKDWSSDWVKYLLQTRGKEYASMISKWCDYQTTRVRNDYFDKKKELHAQLERLKTQSQEELDKYNQIKKMAVRVEAENDLSK